MKHFFNRVLASILPIIGMLLFLAIFIVGIIFFSYVIVILAIIGFILFAIAYIRARILLYQMRRDNKKKTPTGNGRTIDHDNHEQK